MYLTTVNINLAERCSQTLRKTDSNHDKSEVKVVFIRNGFHTTLLHKQENSLSIWNCIPKMDYVKTEKGNNIQNN